MSHTDAELHLDRYVPFAGMGAETDHLSGQGPEFAAAEE